MTTVYKLSGTAQTNVGVDNPANALTDDANVATFNANTDELTVTGFPTHTGNIGRVRLCVRGMRAGVANAQLTISYELSGVPSGSSGSIKFTSPNEDTLHIDVTNDMAWDWPDIAVLGLKVKGLKLGGNKSADTAHVFVEVTTHDSAPLSASNEFKTFIVGDTPLKIIESPSANKSYNVEIYNNDGNTDYIYISHNNTVAKGNGRQLIPTGNYLTAFTGIVTFWVVSPNVTQEISVSLHEV